MCVSIVTGNAYLGLAGLTAKNSAANVTIYVVSCPTASPQCAIAPNLTLTEGISNVAYVSTNSNGVASLNCDLKGSTSAACTNVASGNGEVQRASTTVGADQIVFQAVAITQTMNDTATMPTTVTVTAAPSSSSTSSSKAGAMPISKAPWGVGGVLGAVLVALAAL